MGGSKTRSLPRALRLIFGWSRNRAGVWILLLTSGAVVLAALAGREADRARRTADVLLRDYASFIADKFVTASADQARWRLGLEGFGGGSSPLDLLRAHAEERDRGGATPLPRQRWPEVRYVFGYDAATAELETSGEAPGSEERSRLLGALRGLHPSCGANHMVAFGRIASLGRSAATPAEEWSGLVQTDARGATRRVYGLRLDEAAAAKAYFVPLIDPADGCECVKELLPEGLSSLADFRRAVSFALIDGQGRVVHRTGPTFEGAVSVTKPLSAGLPFPGWSVAVSIDPALVRPLLPYGGRGAPWLAVTLLGALALGSAALAIHSLRKDTELGRLRQDFVSNVSHELKTPLARIRLFNELLLGGRQADPARRARYRQVIDRECRRLTFLLDNVLDFSRLARGARRDQRAWLDMRWVVEEALESFRAASDEGRFTLSTRIENVPPVLGSAEELSRVLINLLDNAVKYSPEGGPVEVRLDAQDGFVRLAVEDRGLGIPEGERHRIFEEFYRVETGDAQPVAGSGLGLALVRRTVEAHSGSVSVESGVGVGSTFTVRLPVAGGPGRPGPPERAVQA